MKIRACRVCGQGVTRFKIQAFALSAAIAALAGALYGHFQSYISPDHFQPLITIYIFLAVTAGGVGRPLGGLAGAYLVVFFLEATRFLGEILPGLQAARLRLCVRCWSGLHFWWCFTYARRVFFPNVPALRQRRSQNHD